MRTTSLWLTTAFVLAITPFCFAENLKFHWQDEFSAREKARLVQWIEHTDQALADLVGPMPFTRHIYFHRRDNSREPVPWAHTQRGATQGVHLYVDLQYPQSQFMSDWTAPHELSHLILPYLGETNAWFAEGFASYMQYQVMGAMGVLENAEISQRYNHRFERAERNFTLPSLPFTEAAPKLRSTGQYPTMYWGGAIYFKQVDGWLQQHTDTDLTGVLRQFTTCCRNDVNDLATLVDVLDSLIQDTVFGRHLARYQTQPGFPKYRKPMLTAPGAAD